MTASGTDILPRIRQTITDCRFWILLCYAAVLVVLACFHEPWFDELHAWRISVLNNPKGIYPIMAYEGHFMLWHMLLYPFAKLGISATVGLPFVSISLMILAAWLLLYLSPFNLWTSLFVLISTPCLYYYPIISRCYAMVPPLLFLLAIYYSKRRTNPIAYGMCLGLMYSTHAYMEGFVLTMTGLWIYDLWQQHRKGTCTKREILGLCLSVFLGLLAFMQIKSVVRITVTNYDNSLHIPMSANEIALFNVRQWASSIYSLINHEPIQNISWLYHLLIWIVAIGLLLFTIYVLKSNRKALSIFLVSFAYMVVFAMVIYPMNMHRLTLPYFIAIFCIWIGGVPKRKATIYTGVLAATMAAGTFTTISNDIRLPYDGYVAIRQQMVEDNNHNTYIEKYPGQVSGSPHVIQICTHCFGSDTLAKSKRFIGIDDLCTQIQKDQPQQCVVYFMSYGWKQYDSYLNKRDEIIVVMDESGYCLADTTPLPKIVVNNIGRYRFEKRVEK